jgi:deoxyxylulose-5-phosphate synthase
MPKLSICAFFEPSDEELEGDMTTTHQLIVTLEENTILCGAGEAV